MQSARSRMPEPESNGGTEPDDDTLIERFRQEGDEHAFTELVLRHQREVYRLAFRLSGNHEDANDLSQEAFVRVYRSLARFRGESSFRTWLYRIVMNVSLNHIRRAKREHMSSLATDGSEFAVAVAPRALDELVRGERSEQLQRAIEHLPDKQRKTLVLKVFHELKYTEIASVMSCSVGTAKANFFHAVQALKRRIVPEGDA